MSTLRTSARERVADAYRVIAESDRPEIWIHLVPEAEALEAAARVDEAAAAGAHLPLAGMIVAVKDNIDVAGLPTTAGCPAFSYSPAASAVSVERLTEQGAIVIGKTNLDQFATGLVGTRSPHGAVRNAINPEWISGGSSSGSAVAVALGMVDAALGTDTAGSGRVPAAFNEVIGLKPSRGLVSGRGVVPACRSLDCVSAFARTVGTATAVLKAIQGFDEADGWSQRFDGDTGSTRRTVGDRIRLGVAPAESLGLSPSYKDAYEYWIRQLADLPQIETVTIDPTAILSVGDLLYQGAFVAERAAAVGDFVLSHTSDVDPVVATIITQASTLSAKQYAADVDRLAHLRRLTQPALTSFDVLALPAAPAIFTIAEVTAEPFETNARLGSLNNFCNLLDMCAATFPANRSPIGEPFGINLFAGSGQDRLVAELAATFVGESIPGHTTNRQDAGQVLLAVAGAHLRGQPLNGELTRLGASFVREATTSEEYRLYALDTTPPKPGLCRVDSGGAAIELEIWSLDCAGFGEFVANVPGPLGIGTLRLDDGTLVKGFICEPIALAGSADITAYKGWRAYRASLA